MAVSSVADGVFLCKGWQTIPNIQYSMVNDQGHRQAQARVSLVIEHWALSIGH
jgi:hypothetical protein